MLVAQKSNIQLRSNLIIEFLFKNQVSENEIIIFKDRNSLTFYGNSFETMVNNLTILSKKYMKYS